MKKSELKTGHIIETRNGERGIVLLNTFDEEDIIIFHNGEDISLSNEYNEDLICFPDDQKQGNPAENFAKRLDIVKVYEPQISNRFLYFNTNSFLELIWERK
jgi:hypothetical protein